MTKDEALKMAYDWLNEYAPTEVVEACKKALEQPAQEPVAWMNDIAYSDEIDNLPANRGDIIPLYAHPAPSWQGLSDDEREMLYDKAIEMPLANLWNDYAYLIEQALKEKNT